VVVKQHICVNNYTNILKIMD